MRTTKLLIAACLLAGPLALPASATYGGKPLAANDPVRKSVVKLNIKAPGMTSYCSGVILSENTIGTAAHCLFRSSDAELPIPPKSVSIKYYYDDTLGHTTSMRYSKLIDMAVLTLEKSHPQGFVVPEFDMRSQEDIAKQSTGATFVYIGHGPPKQSAPNIVTRLESVPVALKVHGGVSLQLLHADRPQPRGTCGGDSGGPVMIRETDGALKLVGIHQARGDTKFSIADSDNNCSRMSIFSTISKLKDWEPDLLEAKSDDAPSEPEDTTHAH
jgi:secreted trypsin-like serine protease